MIIDRLLYLLVPDALHRWASENRAKVRAYALGLATPIIVALSEMYAPEDLSAVIIAALVSAGAVGVGRGTHNVVTPFDYDA